MDNCEIVKILKALGDDTRIEIFGMLRDGKLCGCKILENLNITQPTLSHHMKILCECGIVTAERDWRRTYYSIDCRKLKELTAFFSASACCRGARC